MSNKDKNLSAFPSGTTWTLVETALNDLREALVSNLEIQSIEVKDALGFILSEDVLAERSNPPVANTAVDGFGFAYESLKGSRHSLNLMVGQITPGDNVEITVPKGSAIRILTGASLPKGVDTVVLQEEVTLIKDKVVLDCDLRSGENTRFAGEDVNAGEIILLKGSKIRPQEIGLLVATGVKKIKAYAPLRVGILSTGNEIIQEFSDQKFNKTFDANRPMLINIMYNWGYIPIDLGHVADEKSKIKEKLDEASKICDVIFTSGGASTGSEDYVSQLLQSDGNLYHWRIAMKPGRPLALANWKNKPVIGLPGNPVAAFVCTLVFGRPICGVLSGEGWKEMRSFQVPAGFSKIKKIGRREYLRARIRNDKVEVFHSEGSGRISGLSWAEGLVELQEDVTNVVDGQLVKYIPFSGSI